MKNRIPVFWAMLLLLSLYSCRSSHMAVPMAKLSYQEEQAFSEVFFSAYKEKMLGNYENSIELYEKALAINPSSHAGMYELARLYAAVYRDFEKSSSLIKKAIRLDGGNIWYYVMYSDILEQKGEQSEAADVFGKVSAMDPANRSYYYEWASKLIRAQRYQEAIAVYDKLEEITGIVPELSVQKQKIYLSLGKKAKAVDELLRLSEKYPLEVQYKGMIGELYMSVNETEKAMVIFEEILEIEPDNGFVLLNLADYYQRKNNREKFDDYLVRAFKTDELEVDAKMKIILDFYMRMNQDTSLKPLVMNLGKAMIATHPKEAKSYSIMGDIYNGNGDKALARENFEKVLEFDQSRYPVWEELFFIYLEQEDYVALEEKSALAQELFPLQGLSYFFNGLANLRLKRYEKAIASFDGGRSYVVDNDNLVAEFYANIAEAYQALGEYALSEKNYDKALEIRPNFVMVLNNYSYYLALRNQDLEKALTMALKVNQLMPGNANYEDTLGWVFYALGEYDNAAKWIERSMEHGGDKSAVTLEHYGDVMEKKGEKEKALLYWEKALENGGDMERLNTKIEKLK